MKLFKTTVLILVLLFSREVIFSLHAQNNPVLEGIADAGVINFNGKYYLADVNTNGGFYVSTDLVKWEGTLHVNCIPDSICLLLK